jgi:hypothetical protein
LCKEPIWFEPFAIRLFAERIIKFAKKVSPHPFQKPYLKYYFLKYRKEQLLLGVGKKTKVAVPTIAIGTASFTGSSLLKK